MSAGIIVGYDGSDGAREALRFGAEIADVYGDPLIIAYGYELNRVAGEMADYQAALRDLAEKELGHGIHQAQSLGAKVEAVVIEDSPARALADLARERDARAIVVGSRGESPLRGFLVGSTPHKLLQIADRPVLVVPATQHQVP
jgi:nucleotide-binding universal stress UspA family protein